MIRDEILKYAVEDLEYVPIPGEEYARQTFHELIDCLCLYNEFFLNKEYEINLNNGETLFLELFKENMSHLLGIDNCKIKSKYLTYFREGILGLGSEMASYPLLLGICNKYKEVIEYEKLTGWKTLNYYKIAVKCELFKKMLEIENGNFACIEGTNTRTIRSNKFLCFDSDQEISPYIFLGIFKKENCLCSANTLLLPIKYELFIGDQEFVYPKSIGTSIKQRNDSKSILDDLYQMRSLIEQESQLQKNNDSIKKKVSKRNKKYMRNVVNSF